MDMGGLPDEISNLVVSYDEFVEEMRSSPDLKLEFSHSTPRDIPLVRIGHSGPTIVLIAGVHGDEPTGTEACRRFVKHAGRYHYHFVILPILNPYGYEHNARTNASGKDPEWFRNPEERETIVLMNAILSFTPCAILDLHNTNFLTPQSKDPKGYILSAKGERSIRMAVSIRDYLEERGFSDIIREDMRPEYFLKPSACAQYEKVCRGVFTRNEPAGAFKSFVSRLGIPMVCAESPGKVKSFFFRKKEDIDRYVKNFDRYVEFHYLSILGLIEHLKGHK